MDGGRIEPTTSERMAKGYWAAALSISVAVALGTGFPTVGLDGFGGPPGLWGPGAWGAALWGALRVVFGSPGGELVGRVAVALLVLPALRGFLGPRWSAAGHRLFGLSLLAGLCALLPPGADALLLPWSLALVLLPIPASITLAFLGPNVTPLAMWGVFAAAGAAWETGRRKSAVALIAAAWMNPTTGHALLNGTALRPFLLGWPGDPWSVWVAAHPSAWLLPLWMVAAALWATWQRDGELLRSACLGVLGMVCRPFAGLSCLGASRNREGLCPPRWLSLAGIAALAVFLLFPPAPPPRGAVAWIGSLPGGTVLQIDALWFRPVLRQTRAGAAFTGEGHSLIVGHARGGRLAPPFADAVAPGADVLVVRASYPAFRPPRPYREGWHMVALGPEWAAFARLPAPAGWTARAYDPFQPPPETDGERHAALAEALALTAESPTFFEAQRDSGRLLLDLGRYDEALDHLQAALALRPRSALLLNDVATALHRLGRGPEAEAFYLRSIRADPQELLPRMNVAGLYAGQGRTADAEMVLKDLLAKRPGLLAARRMLIQVLLETGRIDEAVTEVRAIPPDSRTPLENQLAAGASAPGVRP